MIRRGQVLPEGRPAAPPGTALGPRQASNPEQPRTAGSGIAFVRLYPLVALTCLMLVVTGLLLQSGLGQPGRLGASAYAAVVAAICAVSMFRSLRDERDPAVKSMIAQAIDKAHVAGIKIGICGQGPSNHPDLPNSWSARASIPSR